MAFQVELAKTPSERAQGLMFRRSLPKNHGMLFLFAYNGQSSFWMKNTLLSLDLIFIDEAGVIVDLIQNAQPLSEAALTPQAPYRYVLEVVAGSVSQNSIQIGDRVTIPQGLVEGVVGATGGDGVGGVVVTGAPVGATGGGPAGVGEGKVGVVAGCV